MGGEWLVAPLARSLRHMAAAAWCNARSRACRSASLGATTTVKSRETTLSVINNTEPPLTVACEIHGLCKNSLSHFVCIGVPTYFVSFMPHCAYVFSYLA